MKIESEQWVRSAAILLPAGRKFRNIWTTLHACGIEYDYAALVDLELTVTYDISASARVGITVMYSNNQLWLKMLLIDISDSGEDAPGI